MGRKAVFMQSLDFSKIIRNNQKEYGIILKKVKVESVAFNAEKSQVNAADDGFVFFRYDVKISHAAVKEYDGARNSLYRVLIYADWSISVFFDGAL